MTLTPAQTRAFPSLEAEAVCYGRACRLRREADSEYDAIKRARKYQMAAAEFRALGMVAAAERCDEKASSIVSAGFK